MDVIEDIGLKSIHEICKLIIPGEGHSMFHLSQESSAMLNEHGRRNLACHNQKRRCEMNRSRFFLQRVPRVLQRQPIPNKIKLTIEIQHGDFPSLLGQREAWSVNDTVSEIMNDTDCMIQFSDQRSTYASGNVNNQVTITGEFPKIDEAHQRLRYLSPLTIAISLKNIKDDLSGRNVASNLVKWCSEDGELAEFSRIQFNVVQMPQWLLQFQHKGPFMVIRGSYCDHDSIVKASEKIFSLLFDLKTNEEFCARMEVPVLYRRWVVGSPDGVLMRTISMLSGCTIHFPVSSRGQAATSYLLSGNANAVISAVKMFHDVSPVRMEFDVENYQLARPILSNQEKKREYDHFDTEHNVIITMRKSQYEGEFRLDDEEFRHFISLMTSEENLNNLYGVRRKLLSDRIWLEEKSLTNRRLRRPQFIEYLRILITEASAKKISFKTQNYYSKSYNNNYNQNNANNNIVNEHSHNLHYTIGSALSNMTITSTASQKKATSGSSSSKNYRPFCNK